MKKILIILSLFFLALNSHAKDEDLLNASNAYELTMREANVDKKSLVDSSKAILIFPSVKKVGFIVAGMYGNGVALIKNGLNFSAYEASISNGSIGFQIGYEDNYMVLFVMNDEILNSMINANIKLGADATVSLYKASASVGAVSVFDKDVYAFVNKAGAFAGVNIGGFVVNIDTGKIFNQNSYAFENLVKTIKKAYWWAKC